MFDAMSYNLKSEDGATVIKRTDGGSLSTREGVLLAHYVVQIRVPPVVVLAVTTQLARA